MASPSENGAANPGERRLHPRGISRATPRASRASAAAPARAAAFVRHQRGPTQFLREEAEELYWNELEWEKLTSEEMRRGGSELVELAFPGFLAFIDGLLLKEVNRDSLAPASPRPEVVEDVLLFLSRRHLELLVETEPALRLEREMTERLIDLVLYRLHGLPVDGFDPFALSRNDED
jgi:hypothetical protein